MDDAVKKQEPVSSTAIRICQKKIFMNGQRMMPPHLMKNLVMEIQRRHIVEERIGKG